MALLDWLKDRLAPRRPHVSIPDPLWQRVFQRQVFAPWLDPERMARLRSDCGRFLAEKRFHGAHGFVLDDEIMLDVAIRACLLVQRLGLRAYRGWIGIVIYPDEFVIARETEDEDGIVHRYDDVLLGEAWPDGPVILSWDPLASEAADAPPADVVLHEFAHKLDMARGGTANGLPWLAPGMHDAAWQAAFSAAYDDFCARVDALDEAFADHDPAGEAAWQALPLDPYASESPAEFFAVCVETFIHRPAPLAHYAPEVHRQLCALFGLDPLAAPPSRPLAPPG